MAETETPHPLTALPPFDALPAEALARLLPEVDEVEAAAGTLIFEAGQPLQGFYVIADGRVDVEEPGGDAVSHRGRGDMMGERGLMRDGRAVLTARAVEDARLYLLPPATFR
ncbi:MAG: cyclic nucleotide-binding domain-containing protein, partial [Pseudomonadota bacterium]